MNPPPCATRFALPLGLLLLVFTAPAAAQVGSALVAVPWQPDRTVNATAYYLGLQTDSDTVGVDTNLTRAVSFGRVRFDTQDPKAPSFGWLYDHTHLDTTDPVLPERLVTAAGAVGFGLGEVFEGWNASASVGFGFSGDLPFADEDAWYGLGSLVATKRLDQRTALTFILDFDGSRAIFPDVPLPGIQYSVFESPSLRYSLGLPFSTLYYKPDDRWLIDVQYILPIGGRANIEYQITDQWIGYTSYSGTTRGFHLDGDNENRRLFFTQDRVELGVRFEPSAEWTWTFAGGWAFGQEFTRGFDVRDDDLVRELDDAAFLRVGLKLAY